MSDKRKLAQLTGHPVKVTFEHLGPTFAVVTWIGADGNECQAWGQTETLALHYALQAALDDRYGEGKVTLG